MAISSAVMKPMVAQSSWRSSISYGLAQKVKIALQQSIIILPLDRRTSRTPSLSRVSDTPLGVFVREIKVTQQGKKIVRIPTRLQYAFSVK